MRFAGKVALVTGASKGIGAAVAKSFAADGASVVVNFAQSEPAARAVVGAIEAHGGRAIAVRSDVSKPDAVRTLIDAAISHFGRIDVVVNNSGVMEFAPIGAITVGHFEKVFGTNVLGTLLVTQTALAHLPEGASVINIGSLVTSFTPPGTAVYTGSKGAIEGITGVLARELGPKKIRVNAISPGYVMTEGTASAGIDDAESTKTHIAENPLGVRVYQPTLQRLRRSSLLKMLGGSQARLLWQAEGVARAL